MSVPLSVLDLVPVARGESVGSAIAASVALARCAEERGYRRVWYAEHHNMPSIASAATSVLIAHIGAHTTSIRLGSGGVMLPNHPPLVIAEQFGTLAAMYPGRIDLGLGRAPGTDQVTARALRRDHRAVDTFPSDIVELQGYLADEAQIPGVQAIPGRGTHVPLYVLGSSLYGAQLGAALGLPYAFASHFAPQSLFPAVAAYRSGFRPSAQLASPYVIAAVNVIAADTSAAARQQLADARRRRAVAMFGQGRSFTDDEADALLDAGAAAPVDEMLTYTAVGTPDEVRSYLERFASLADADELILALQSPTVAERLRSASLTAAAWELVPA